MRNRPSAQSSMLDPFYPVFLWKEALFVVALIAFQKLGQPANLVTAIILIFMSLRSAKGAVQALALVTLLSYLSFFYFPVGFNSAAKWIVLLTASSAGIMHSYKSNSTFRIKHQWLFPLIAFIAVAGISSGVASPDPEMALFKLFTFAVASLGAMYVFSCQDLKLPYITSWFYTVWLVLLILSIPLLKLGNGYMPRTGMFLGILGQSQAYGVFMAPFALYIVVRWLVGLRLSVWHKIFAVIGCYTVYLSSSRTAVFSFLLSLIAVAMIYTLRSNTAHAVKNRLISKLTIVVVGIVVLNILTSGGLGLIAGTFSRKYGEKTDILATRSGKLDNAQQTFEARPVFGKGFGLAMDGEELIVKRDPILNLPLSAPVEAGVIYVAAPAQLGILGVTFLLFFLYVYMMPIFKHGAAPFIGLAAVCFFVNFGEYVFFSTGGVGMYHWLIYGLAYHAALRFPEVTVLPKPVTMAMEKASA